MTNTLIKLVESRFDGYYIAICRDEEGELTAIEISEKERQDIAYQDFLQRGKAMEEAGCEVQEMSFVAQPVEQNQDGSTYDGLLELFNGESK